MRVALAQINPCIGDLEGNVERCLAALGVAIDTQFDGEILIGHVLGKGYRLVCVMQFRTGLNFPATFAVP